MALFKGDRAFSARPIANKLYRNIKVEAPGVSYPSLHGDQLRDTRLGISRYEHLSGQALDLQKEGFLPVRPPRGDAENAVEDSGSRRLYLFGHG